MPKPGKAFTMTSDRRTKMTDMLRRQWTVSGIACEYGISYKFLIKLMKKEKMNHKAIRMSGLLNLKADTYSKIEKIAEPDKAVKAGLDFLKQYPIVEDDDLDVKSVGSDKKLNASIQLAILAELSDE